MADSVSPTLLLLPPQIHPPTPHKALLRMTLVQPGRCQKAGQRLQQKQQIFFRNYCHRGKETSDRTGLSSKQCGLGGGGVTKGQGQGQGWNALERKPQSKGLSSRTNSTGLWLKASWGVRQHWGGPWGNWIRHRGQAVGVGGGRFSIAKLTLQGF